MSTPLKRALLAITAVLLTLGAAELVARGWVAYCWPHQLALELTHFTETRGRYTSHPVLGYVLTPWFESADASHDGRGLRRGNGRGHPTERRPGIPRIALLGASTVYGIYVRDGQTAAAQLEEQFRVVGRPVEVFNAGVPGWTSHETLASWRERVAPLAPDVAVIIDGRNDAFAQLWNGYRDDYAHYRDPNYELRTSNAIHKRIFRVSHLAMVLISRGDWFGYSRKAEHPLYGAVDYAALPSPEEALAAASDPSRAVGFERNLRSVVAELRGSDIQPALATMPFRPEGFASGIFVDGTSYIGAITLRVRANNELVRRLAAEFALPLADLETLSTEPLLHDDCHFNQEGERRAAALLRAAVEPLL